MSAELVPAAYDPRGYTVSARREPQRAAVCMLPETAPGVGVAISAGVLLVQMPSPPTPAEFATLERASGMPVTIEVLERDAWAALLAEVQRLVPNRVPRSAVALLDSPQVAAASDLFLQVGKAPSVRISGSVATLTDHAPLNATDIAGILDWLVGPARPARAVTTIGAARWRVTHHRSLGHPEVALRRISDLAPRLEDLSLPAGVVHLASARGGLVLVAGRPGSGRSTTAAALLDRVNSTRAARIVTFESPVEHRHTPRSSVVSHHEIGHDIVDVTSGLRLADELLADVVLVGELTTPEDMRAAVAASLSGRLVIATLASAPSAAASIQRLLTAYGDDAREAGRHAVAEALTGVLAQELTSGSNGLTAVCEVFLAGTAGRQLVRAGRLHELASEMELAGDTMVTLEQSLARLVRAGRIEESAAVTLANDATRLTEHLRRG